MLQALELRLQLAQAQFGGGQIASPGGHFHLGGHRAQDRGADVGGGAFDGVSPASGAPDISGGQMAPQGLDLLREVFQETLRHRPGVKRQNISVQVARTPATAVEVVKVKPGQGI